MSADASLFTPDSILGAAVLATRDGLNMRGVGCFSLMPDASVLGRIDMRRADLQRGDQTWFVVPARCEGREVRVVGVAAHILDAGNRNGFMGACVVAPAERVALGGYRGANLAAEALFEEFRDVTSSAGRLDGAVMDQALRGVAHLPTRPALEVDRADYQVLTIPQDWDRMIGLDALMLLVDKQDRQRARSGYALLPRTGAQMVPAAALMQHVKLLFTEFEWEARYNEAAAKLRETEGALAERSQQRNRALEELEQFKNAYRSEQEQNQRLRLEAQEARNAVRLEPPQQTFGGPAQTGGYPAPATSRHAAGAARQGRSTVAQDRRNEIAEAERQQAQQRADGPLWSALALGGTAAVALMALGFFVVSSIIGGSKPDALPQPAMASAVTPPAPVIAPPPPIQAQAPTPQPCGTTRSFQAVAMAMQERCVAPGTTQQTCGRNIRAAYGDLITELNTCGIQEELRRRCFTGTVAPLPQRSSPQQRAAAATYLAALGECVGATRTSATEPPIAADPPVAVATVRQSRGASGAQQTRAAADDDKDEEQQAGAVQPNRTANEQDRSQGTEERQVERQAEGSRQDDRAAAQDDRSPSREDRVPAVSNAGLRDSRGALAPDPRCTLVRGAIPGRRVWRCPEGTED